MDTLADVSKRFSDEDCPGYGGAEAFKCNAFQRCCGNECCLKDYTIALGSFSILAVLLVTLLVVCIYLKCKAKKKMMGSKNDEEKLIDEGVYVVDERMPNENGTGEKGKLFGKMFPG